MSLARSASGPGGLSINTGSANLFGSNTPQQPPAGGGLFGAATSQPAQAAPSQPAGSLFGSTATQTPASQPQQAGGLFGQTAAATQPQQAGGLFGATTTQQPQQSTGGLFGGTTTSQPAQAGGLFGGTQTQQPQQQAGGLFGGAATQQQQQQPQAAGGLFGGSTANTGGMFGTKPAAATTGGGLFGQTQSQPQQSQAGGLTLGQSTAQQQTVPGVRIDLSNIKSTTRFNDLQETLQKEIAQIDEAIQRCIKDKDAVDAFLPSHGEQLAAIPTDVGFVTRKSEGAHNALSSDIRAIDQLRELVKTDAGHARLSFKAIDNLKLPSQYHQAGLWANRGQQVGGAGAGGQGGAADAQSNTDLISFFSATAGEMDDMMKKYEQNLGEIEVHLHGVQGNMLEQMQRVAAQSKSTTPGGVDQRVVELAAVLRDFEESILKVAGVVGGVKEGVTELQLKDFLGHGS
ncbi:nucleoporin FG repeat region-domain-containing protein [Chaetomium tenue]|uniref:Nucleoporin FG repeat region-domain-containing protein n=1 Tax=Chaetomium tenue TaxID=1854479 RepID=A0ACB7P7D8_9PEZI|nr:nucleoporin FG repeat region-domain-containing protein [Chaetomium globosum]